MLEKIKQTADFLRSRVSDIPQTAIILGTGLGDLVDHISDKQFIPYKEIPKATAEILSSDRSAANSSWRCRDASIIMKATT